VDSTKTGCCQLGKHGLWDHGHVDQDTVTFLDTMFDKDTGKMGYLEQKPK
jgi:hypothetical protein